MDKIDFVVDFVKKTVHKLLKQKLEGLFLPLIINYDLPRNGERYLDLNIKDTEFASDDLTCPRLTFVLHSPPV